MDNILITICARGGSKGIPGKNIRKLNNKPLIAYTIEIAFDFISKFGGNIVLSTDSSDIKKVASEYGLYSDYIRPKFLAGDEVGKIDVISDAILFSERANNLEYDYIIDLDLTSPLRTLDDIKSAYFKLRAKKGAINIFSVNKANRNPYFNMVEQKDDGFVKLVKDGQTIKSRQKAPKVYDMNASFYIYRRDFFLKKYSTPITDKSLVYVMDHVCFDLDEPVDFTILEIMMRENLLDIKL